VFAIRSSTSSHEFRFARLANDSILAELDCGALSASRRFSCFTDSQGLATLFSELAAFSTPWSGQRVWESIEGDFSLTATCDALGHVTLASRISHNAGGAEHWHVSAALVCEFGQLHAISLAAAREFAAMQV
jgi:hypothetical protein